MINQNTLVTRHRRFEISRYRDIGLSFRQIRESSMSERTLKRLQSLKKAQKLISDDFQLEIYEYYKEQCLCRRLYFIFKQRTGLLDIRIVFIRIFCLY